MEEEPTCNINVSSKKRRNTELTQEDPDSDETRLIEFDNTCKRRIHSKIEKRRRDKINGYINQLSNLIPIHKSKSQKMDKISVVQVAVEYLKSIRILSEQFSNETLKNSFINDSELQKLIAQVTEGFLFVVSCESTRIIYVSQSVSKILEAHPADVLGRSIYDIIHPFDAEKVKEEISCVDLRPRSQPVTTQQASKNITVDVPSEQLCLYPGHRRSFFFRMITNVDDTRNNMNGIYTYNGFKYDDVDRYTLIQCTGYLKSVDPVKINVEGQSATEDTCTSPHTSFIAFGRKVSSSMPQQPTRAVTYLSKHSIDGRFLSTEHGITLITGYLPQEILGTNIYDHIHIDDIHDFSGIHQSMMHNSTSTMVTKIYRIRTKHGNYIKLRSEWKTFVNPWKQEIQFFYLKNTAVPRVEDAKNDTRKLEGSTIQLGNEVYWPGEKNDFHELVPDLSAQDTNYEKEENICGDGSMEMIMKLMDYDANSVN